MYTALQASINTQLIDEAKQRRLTCPYSREWRNGFIPSCRATSQGTEEFMNRCLSKGEATITTLD